ncbi:MAG: nuclear transport factor 2 family protein [Pseudomonadota bacterium]|nr:nuclear transport factor 2 family protein [Pseudomonadota bacterium]
MQSSRVFFQPFAVCAMLLVVLLSSPLAKAGDDEPEQEDEAPAAIEVLLQDFLANVGEAATHDRFWADDLVYTSAGGEVRSKREIMKSFQETVPPASTPAAPDPGYSAEDIVVRQYGDSAALTFQLIARNGDGSRSSYRNSGMFVLRDARWQAVTWQATRVPEVPAN